MNESVRFLLLLGSAVLSAFLSLFVLSRIINRCERASLDEEEKRNEKCRRKLIEDSLVTKKFEGHHEGDLGGNNCASENKTQPATSGAFMDEPSTSSKANDPEHKAVQTDLGEGSEDSSRVECYICLGDYEDGQNICHPANGCCPHTFHKECITPWLLKHDDCPCCRRRYVGYDEVESGGINKRQVGFVNDDESRSGEDGDGGDGIVVSMEEGLAQ